MIALIIILVILISVLYHFLNGQKSFFTNRGVKFHQATPFLGAMWRQFFRLDDFFDFHKKFQQKYSKESIVGYYEFLQPVFYLQDPELVKQITVKYFPNFMNRRITVSPETDAFASNIMLIAKSEHWRKLRHALSPSFTSNKMKFTFETSEAYMTKLMGFIEEEIKKNNGVFRVNLFDFYRRCTSDIIATTAIGIEPSAFKDENEYFYKLCSKMADLTGWFFFKFITYSLYPGVGKLFKMQLFDSEAVDAFKKLLTTAIEERKTNKIHRPDMVQVGLDSGLDIESLIAQVGVMIAAGFDTQAASFVDLSYELAKNPYVQNKLSAEIDDALKKGETKYEDLRDMKYLNAVIQESLRKYPVVTFLDRVCSEKTTVQDSNGKDYTFLPGDKIAFSIVGFHYDPTYFPEPEKFDPHRFLDSKDNDMNGYMPYSNGPRNCIGMRLANMHLQLMFFKLLSKFKLECNDKTPVKFQAENGSIALKPKNGEVYLDFKMKD